MRFFFRMIWTKELLFRDGFSVFLRKPYAVGKVKDNHEGMRFIETHKFLVCALDVILQTENRNTTYNDIWNFH